MLSRYCSLDVLIIFPRVISDSSLIFGEVIRSNASQDWNIILIPTEIDGKSIDGSFTGHMVKNALRQIQIEPGKHTIEILRIRKLTNSSKSDNGIRKVKAVLLPERTYQVRGEIIVGTTIKYWIEDKQTGEPITDVYYDPAGLKDRLVLIDSLPPPMNNSSTLHFITKERAFVNKSNLTPDHDCFNIFFEVPINVAATVVFNIILAFGGVIPSPLDYGFRVYEDICLDVKEGHQYELKHHNELWYELWDITDNKLINKIRRADLDIIVDGVY